MRAISSKRNVTKTDRHENDWMQQNTLESTMECYLCNKSDGHLHVMIGAHVSYVACLHICALSDPRCTKQIRCKDLQTPQRQCKNVRGRLSFWVNLNWATYLVPRSQPPAHARGIVIFTFPLTHGRRQIDGSFRASANSCLTFNAQRWWNLVESLRSTWRYYTFFKIFFV